MTSTAVSAEDQSLFRWLAGGRLLIAIIFLGTAVLFIVLWAKRQILRLFLINRKGPLDNPGNNAPRHLKKEIEENFNKIAAMRIEAQLLCDQSDAHVSMYTSFVEERDDSTYKYRRKAFDLMSCLDELLSRVNIGLARKPSQNVRDHLMLLQGPPYSPFEGHSDLCENVTHLYEHARYGAKDSLLQLPSSPASLKPSSSIPTTPSGTPLPHHHQCGRLSLEELEVSRTRTSRWP